MEGGKSGKVRNKYVLPSHPLTFSLSHLYILFSDIFVLILQAGKAKP